MKMYSYPDKKIWPEIIKRPVADNSSLEKSVKKILQKVKEKGDKAVIKFTRQFDEVKLKNITITSHEIMAAEVLLSDVGKNCY